MPEHTIGADISKDHIDLYRLKDGARLKAANDRKGFAAILKWIGNEVVDRIVYEPTGPYHKAFERFMAVRGLTLSKVNPLSARRFCEAKGQLAKTDRIDAKMLALFGALLDPRILEPGSETIHDQKRVAYGKACPGERPDCCEKQGKEFNTSDPQTAECRPAEAD